jgi:hypothetical protein
MKPFWLIMIAALTFGIRGGEPEAVTVRESDRQRFLPETLDEGMEWLQHYGTFPESVKPLEDNAVQKLIVGEMLALAGQALKKDVLPGETFAVKHAALFPAGTFSSPWNREDCVYLRYSIGSRSYLMVECGGGKNRFLLFVYERRKDKQIALDELMETPIKHGSTWLLFGDTASLLVNKWEFFYPDRFGPRPARASQPDEWFKGARERLKVDEKIEKARQRRLEGSPEYVKELLARLPKGDRDGEQLYKQYLEYNELVAAEKDTEKRGHYITGRAQVIEDLEHRVMWAEQKPKPPDEPKIKEPE